MTALLPQAKFGKILDPCCGSGKLISTVSNLVSSEEAVGVDLIRNVIESATSTYPEIDFIQGNSSEELELTDDFDLVIGALPLGARCERRKITPDISTNNTSDVILYRSLLKLKPQGIGIFLAAQGLLFGRSSKMITKTLSSEGINPIGLFYVGNPLGERSGIPGIIIIFQRNGMGLSVVGKAPNGSESFLPKLRNMIYDSGDEIEGYRRSVFENVSSFTNDGEPIFADNESNIESLKLRLNNIGTDIYSFDDVVISYSHTKPPDYVRLPHKENSIYLPKARGVVKVNQDELSTKLKNYYQIVLDPLIAKDVYVMDTMNGKLGKKIFDICASGVTIPQISKSGLKKMLFPLPSIEEQEEWADVSLEIKHKQDELDTLKHLIHERSNISEIYEILNSDRFEETSLKELLSSNESQTIEFKSSLWTQYNEATGERVKQQKEKMLELEDEVVKTVAAFLNTDGGTLLIGVKDKPRSSGDAIAEIRGIEPDFKWPKKKDTEGYTHALLQIFKNAYSNPIATHNTTISFPEFEGKIICRIDVEALPRKVGQQCYTKTKIKTEFGKKALFFARISDTTENMSSPSQYGYIRHHFEGYTGENNSEDSD
jgi:hypothetical protein